MSHRAVNPESNSIAPLRLRLARTLLCAAALAGCDSERISAPQKILTLTPDSPSLLVASSIRLRPSSISTTPLSDTAFTWTSSAPEVVAVDATGKITGRSVGSARVRVLSTEGYGETEVSVITGGGAIRSWASTTCAVATGGDLYCWGQNDFGQAGTGDRNTPVIYPEKVVGGLRFSAVAPSLEHTCGIAESGTYCWGNNWTGQGGDGTSGGVRLAPARVAGGFSFTDVSTQSSPESRWPIDCSERLCTATSCAITAAGELFCWGDGVATPTRLSVTTSFADVLLGAAYTCGLDDANLAYCWGRSDARQTQGGFTAGTAPPRVPGDREFQSIGVGAAHNCAIDFDGDAYCWGANASGQLGASSTESCGVSFPIYYIPCRGTPARVETEQKFLSIAAGGQHSCALSTTLQVFCWGSNLRGQLGDGSAQNSATPVRVSGGLRFRSLTAGWSHTCAISLDGNAYCWGANGGGELGNGTLSPASTPKIVSGGLTFH